MRTTAVAVAATIAAGVLGYYIAGFRQSGEPGHAITTDSASLRGPEKPPSSKGRSTSSRPPRKSEELEFQERQGRINQQLAEIDARVRTLEVEPEPSADDSDQQDSDNARKDRISESDFGRWLERRLETEEADADWTNRFVAVVDQQKETMSGVHLEEASCGRRFCRATFSGDDGKHPNLRNLYGGVPDTRGGFTINREDGQVELYLIRSGESMDGLRAEALASAAQ